jgi:hypothetical protein
MKKKVNHKFHQKPYSNEDWHEKKVNTKLDNLLLSI